MENFAQYNYDRPDFTIAKKELEKCYSQLKKAGSFDEFKETILSIKKINSDIESNYSLASLRNRMDKDDKKYVTALEYFNREIPRIAKIQSKINEFILESNYLTDVKEYFGEMFVSDLKTQSLIQSKKLIHLQYYENQLFAKYKSLLKEQKHRLEKDTDEFYGYYDLSNMLANKSQGQRKKAMHLLDTYYVKHYTGLQVSYGELVKTHEKMAKRMGYDSYLSYINTVNKRNDITDSDRAAIRSAVKEYLVPVAIKLEEIACKATEITDNKAYQDTWKYILLNTSIKDSQGAINLAIDKLFEVLPESMNTFYKELKDKNLIDVSYSKDRYIGTAVSYLDEYEEALVWGKTSGTVSDITKNITDIVRAYQYRKTITSLDKGQEVFMQKALNEVLPSFVELESCHKANIFIAGSKDRYRLFNLWDYVENTLFYFLLDEYQEATYLKTDLTTRERCELWKKLEDEYQPWKNYGDNFFFNNGGTWASIHQNFLYQFYNFDYALGKVMALDLFRTYNLENVKGNTMLDCLSNCGGLLGFKDTLLKTGLNDPFSNKTVKEASEYLLKEIDSYGFK